jgi:hypothetical protein
VSPKAPSPAEAEAIAAAAQRSEIARIAANTRWSRLSSVQRRAAPGLRASHERLERQVDPEGVLAPDVRAKLVENARQAQLASPAGRSLDAVTDADAEWFAAHPHATFYHRPITSVEITEHDICRRFPSTGEHQGSCDTDGPGVCDSASSLCRVTPSDGTNDVHPTDSDIFCRHWGVIRPPSLPE